LTYTLGFAPPTLTIAQTAPAQALLQWPTNYAGFRVNSSTNLRAAGFWRLVTNATTVNGAFYNVSITTTNTAQFFRLRKL
jgi:hypothetical protein